MSELTVRRATAADAERLLVIWQEVTELLTTADRRWKLTANSSETWLAALHEWLMREDMMVVVIERKGYLIGYAVGQDVPNVPGFEPTRIGLVTDLAIDPHGRGDGGVGTQLVAALKAWFRERGLTQLQARVPTSQPIAQTFWRASGANVLFNEMWMKLE
jgi:L-amino acid N-acyltransferase YncA